MDAKILPIADFPNCVTLSIAPSENIPEKTFGTGTSRSPLRTPILKSEDSHNPSGRITAIVG